MTQTFTPDLDLTAQDTEKELTEGFLSHAGPSNGTIQNILNYSRNLEIRKSQLIPAIEIVKS